MWMSGTPDLFWMLTSFRENQDGKHWSRQNEYNSNVIAQAFAISAWLPWHTFLCIQIQNYSHPRPQQLHPAKEFLCLSLSHFFLLLPLAYKNKWVAFASQYLYCSWVCCKLMKWWSLQRNAVKALHLPDVRVALKVALRVKLHLGAGSSLLSVYKKYWMPF